MVVHEPYLTFRYRGFFLVDGPCLNFGGRFEDFKNNIFIILRQTLPSCLCVTLKAEGKVSMENGVYYYQNRKAY